VHVDVVDGLELGELAEVVIVVKSLALRLRASRTSLASTPSPREIAVVNLHLVFVLRWSRLRISRPRRPRARLMGSLESAICISSRRTKRGTTRMPSRKLDSIRSAMRPSMITLVSSSSRLSAGSAGRSGRRDDQREILLVAAHGEDDADVAKAQEEPSRISQRTIASVLSNRPEWSMSCATTIPSRSRK